MNDKEYMSGCQLRQYLRISTRKMKYLMDNNYIPHENTGHATHKYRVLIQDAEAFKYRMENETGFLAELTGMFTSRTEWHPRPLLEVTEENCTAFRLWLEVEWAELPDALSTSAASKLIGCQPQRIHETARLGLLTAVKCGSVQYVPKTEFISYIASPEKLSTPTGAVYKELIRTFKARQSRIRENEKRKIKRKQKGGATLDKEESIDRTADRGKS